MQFSSSVQRDLYDQLITIVCVVRCEMCFYLVLFCFRSICFRGIFFSFFFTMAVFRFLSIFHNETMIRSRGAFFFLMADTWLDTMETKCSSAAVSSRIRHFDSLKINLMPMGLKRAILKWFSRLAIIWMTDQPCLNHWQLQSWKKCFSWTDQ